MKKTLKKTKKGVDSKAKTKAKAKKLTQAAKPIGVATHFFNEIKVAIVKFKQPVRVGTELNFKGATTDFNEIIKSMQLNHESITTAPKGKEIGIKVKKRVRQGDAVYEV